MILSYDGLAALRGKVSLVGGGFDPLHQGHIAYFTAAAALGLPVLCSVDGDHYVERKHKPLLDAQHRLIVLDALRPLSYVYLNTGATVDVLNELRPAFYVKGMDWQGRLPAAEVEACKTHNIEIRYVDTMFNSSSKLLRKFLGESVS